MIPHSTIKPNLKIVPRDEAAPAVSPAAPVMPELIRRHITDDNNGACWALAGDAQAPTRVDAPDNQESPSHKLTKDQLVAGLKESVARCDKAFAAVTETNMAERNGANGRRSKLGALIYNTSHTNEHYGNIVTYMRLNNMVPPSSAPRGQ